MATKYYKVHGGKLTLREYWRMSPDMMSFGIAVVFKLFGGFPFTASIPKPDGLDRLPWDELPASARKGMKAALKQLQDAGLSLQFCHKARLLEPNRLGVQAVCLDRDGPWFACVNHGEEGETVKTEVNVVSRFEDGTFGVTTQAKKQLKPDPAHVYDRRPDADAAELVAAHRKNVDRWSRKGREAVRLTPATLERAVLDGERGFVAYHVSRGVFVPMSRDEIDAQREAEFAEAGEDD